MIDQSQVYKCLERKTVIFGFELPDLFALSILLCVLNIIFSTSDYKLMLTWGPTLALAFLLRLMKMGKAENYFFHFIRYHISPGIYHAFPVVAASNDFFRLRRKGRLHVRFHVGQAD